VATRARDPFTLIVVRQVVPADVQQIAHVTRNRHIVYAGLERYVQGGGIARREHAAPETQEFDHAKGEGTIAGQSQAEPRRRRFAEEATVAHASPRANEVDVGCAGQQLRGAAAEISIEPVAEASEYIDGAVTYGALAQSPLAAVVMHSGRHVAAWNDSGISVSVSAKLQLDVEAARGKGVLIEELGVVGVVEHDAVPPIIHDAFEHDRTSIRLTRGLDLQDVLPSQRGLERFRDACRGCPLIS